MLYFSLFLTSCLVSLTPIYADLNLIDKFEAWLDRSDSLGRSSGLTVDTLVDIGLKKLAGKIEQNVCQTNGSDIYGATRGLYHCIIKARFDSQICNVKAGVFRQCIVPLANELEKCIGTNAKGLPTMIVDSVSFGNEHLCEARVKDIIELFNPCIMLDFKSLTSCFDTHSSEKYQSLFDIPDIKEELCRELKDSKKCFVDEATKGCESDLPENIISQLYDVLFTKPCEMYQLTDTNK